MIYRLFDLYWNIETIHKETNEYLKEYVTSETEADEHIKITKEEIRDEMLKYPEYNEIYHELVCIFRHISQEILKYDGMFIHSAVVSHDNEGYMFLGKSGAGKSTHAMLWERYFKDRAEIINGDKPIVMFKDDGIYAYGNPWGGKEGKHLNKNVKLKAACFIVQSDTNKIRKLVNKEIFKLMLNQIDIPNDITARVTSFDLLNRLLNDIPFYILECNLSEDAVITAYNFMKGETE